MMRILVFLMTIFCAAFRYGQCRAITKAGKQCSVGAKNEEGFCGPHTDHPPKKVVNKTTEVVVAKEEEEMTIAEADEMFWRERRSKSNLVVSGSGSRSLQVASLEECNRVLDWLCNRPVVGLKALKEQYRDIIVMTGLAEGFDAALAQAAIQEDIPYIAAIPYPGYGEFYWGWPPSHPKGGSVTKTDRREKFKEYMDQALHVVYVCKDSMYGKANLIRNQYMVEHGDVFYVYNKESRGTAHAYGLIKNAGKPHHIIPMEGR